MVYIGYMYVCCAVLYCVCWNVKCYRLYTLHRVSKMVIPKDEHKIRQFLSFYVLLLLLLLLLLCVCVCMWRHYLAMSVLTWTCGNAKFPLNRNYNQCLAQKIVHTFNSENKKNGRGRWWPQSLCQPSVHRKYKHLNTRNNYTNILI